MARHRFIRSTVADAEITEDAAVDIVDVEPGASGWLVVVTKEIVQFSPLFLVVGRCGPDR
jgi:hypothetical protein